MKSRKSAAASDNLESLSSSALVDAKTSTNAARSSRLVTSNFRPSENLLSFIVENPDETAAAEVEACSDMAKLRGGNGQPRAKKNGGKERGLVESPSRQALDPDVCLFGAKKTFSP